MIEFDPKGSRPRSDKPGSGHGCEASSVSRNEDPRESSHKGTFRDTHSTDPQGLSQAAERAKCQTQTPKVQEAAEPNGSRSSSSHHSQRNAWISGGAGLVAAAVISVSGYGAGWAIGGFMLASGYTFVQLNLLRPWNKK
ncbi:MAG: hypothetical protein KDD42_00140 [Bdellovibrionales bacterium]|nr:hypothetical protein [Bdellovibrionales bacterium]